MEHNAAPERLDLSDKDLRLAKECGCRIVINTDAHMTRVVGEWRYGIRQLRRAWLAAGDVLNTLGAGEFLGALEEGRLGVTSPTPESLGPGTPKDHYPLIAMKLRRMGHKILPPAISGMVWIVYKQWG